MKILITNIVTLNAGDAAILYATIDLLRKAFNGDIEFIVYDNHGELPKKYYPEFTFRKLLYFTRESKRIKSSDRWVSRLSRLIGDKRFRVGLWAVKHSLPFLPDIFLQYDELRDLNEYKTADLIVSSGGTYLVENYSLDARIFDYRMSLYLDRPLVFFTQSLGPFADPTNRRSLRPIFNSSVAILVRDSQSLDNLKELGVTNNKLSLAADAAFALSEEQTLEAAKSKGQDPTRPLRVAISVREWRHFKNIEPQRGMMQYHSALRALSTHLVHKHRAQVTFLSSCQGIPEYWTDDSKVAQHIVDGLDQNTRECVLVDSSFHSPKVLLEMLRNYDVVIATRMHMAILALGAGTPVFPIAYEFKMRELFVRLGQVHLVHDIEDLSPKTLIEAFDQFLEDLPNMRGTLFTAVQNERESALASGKIIKQVFEEYRQANPI